MEGVLNQIKSVLLSCVAEFWLLNYCFNAAVKPFIGRLDSPQYLGLQLYFLDIFNRFKFITSHQSMGIAIALLKML